MPTIEMYYYNYNHKNHMIFKLTPKYMKAARKADCSTHFSTGCYIYLGVDLYANTFLWCGSESTTPPG